MLNWEEEKYTYLAHVILLENTLIMYLVNFCLE